MFGKKRIEELEAKIEKMQREFGYLSTDVSTLQDGVNASREETKMEEDRFVIGNYIIHDMIRPSPPAINKVVCKIMEHLGLHIEKLEATVDTFILAEDKEETTTGG